uniref:hypothetical protein n=1 Tax=Neobacillus niacini TaxID=86668 RepID=UPI000AB15B6A
VTILALSDHQDEKLILDYLLHRTKIILLKVNIFQKYLQEDINITIFATPEFSYLVFDSYVVLMQVKHPLVE